MSKIKLDFPITEDTLMLRTDFSDEITWLKLKEIINTPNEDGFKAYVNFCEDRKYEKLNVEEILANIPDNYEHSIVFFADEVTFNSNENTILCVDIENSGKNRFRVIPAKMWSVENNLSISNMGFEEFFGECDDNGIFWGF